MVYHQPRANRYVPRPDRNYLIAFAPKGIISTREHFHGFQASLTAQPAPLGESLGRKRSYSMSQASDGHPRCKIFLQTSKLCQPLPPLSSTADFRYYSVHVLVICMFSNYKLYWYMLPVVQISFRTKPYGKNQVLINRYPCTSQQQFSYWWLFRNQSGKRRLLYSRLLDEELECYRSRIHLEAGAVAEYIVGCSPTPTTWAQRNPVVPL